MTLTTGTATCTTILRPFFQLSSHRSHCTFACTGAMQPILHKGNLEGAMERAAMLVDISVPRNIDDQVWEEQLC